MAIPELVAPGHGMDGHGNPRPAWRGRGLGGSGEYFFLVSTWVFATIEGTSTQATFTIKGASVTNSPLSLTKAYGSGTPNGTLQLLGSSDGTLPTGYPIGQLSSSQASVSKVQVYSRALTASEKSTVEADTP